jgi:hypothetical protein
MLVLLSAHSLAPVIENAITSIPIPVNIITVYIKSNLLEKIEGREKNTITGTKNQKRCQLSNRKRLSVNTEKSAFDINSKLPKCGISMKFEVNDNSPSPGNSR